MNRTFAWIALLAPLAVAPVRAGPELAAKSKCMSCHGVDKKMLGPAFNDISAKYTMGQGCGKDAAAATLTESILKATKNKWGKIPMPPQKIPAEDARTLAKWILVC